MRATRNFGWMMQLALAAAGATAIGPTHAQDYFGDILPDTMCRTGETVLFACDTSHAKKIAACARPGAGTPFGDIRYRFGTPTHTELEFPIAAQPLATYASGASFGDGGRGELTFLSLKRAEATYSVYSKVVAPTYQQDGASESDGVLVERAGKVIANIHCDVESIPHAGVLADRRLFGVAVPLAIRSLPIFPEFAPAPSQPLAETEPNIIHPTKEWNAVSDYVTSLQLPTVWDTHTLAADLNGDGLIDTVVFAAGHVKGQCRSGQIHVLMHTAHDTWLPASSANLGCDSNLEVQVDIKSGSLFVSMDAVKGADAVYQFQWNHGAFELIGMRVQYASGGLDDEPFFAADSEFNPRTGMAVFKRTVDIEPGSPPLKADPRPVRVHARGPVCTLDQLTYKLDFCADQWRAGDTSVADLMLPR